MWFGQLCRQFQLCSSCIIAWLCAADAAGASAVGDRQLITLCACYCLSAHAAVKPNWPLRDHCCCAGWLLLWAACAACVGTLACTSWWRGRRPRASFSSSSLLPQQVRSACMPPGHTAAGCPAWIVSSVLIATAGLILVAIRHHVLAEARCINQSPVTSRHDDCCGGCSLMFAWC